MGHHFDPHLRYIPISILCQLIRSSILPEATSPKRAHSGRSARWRIITSRTTKRLWRGTLSLLLSVPWYSSPQLTITIIGTNETWNNPLLTFRYLVYITCQVVIINIYHARKVKRFLDGLCNTSYLTQEGCKLSKSLWGDEKSLWLYETVFLAALAALYQYMGRTDWFI